MKRQRLKLQPVWGVMTAFAALAALFAPATSARAASLDGTSRSYLLSRETTTQAKLLPGFEYLDFSLKDLKGESISAHFGGWGSYDFENETGDTDLQYAFVSFKRGTANSVVNVGRVMVFEGVAAERVDGAYARTDLRGGFGASAFGGVPVLTGLSDLPGNEMIYGARLSHELPGLYTFGLSYLKSELNSKTFREEEGVDLWLRPAGKVELLGRSSYNAETTGWMEHSYNLLLGPFGGLRLNTEAAQYTYENYFIGLTNNAFLLKTGALGTIDPKESLGILGETASYAFTDRVSASLEYKKYSYDIAGAANRFGVSATYAVPGSGGAGISLHRMDGETDRLSYNQYRAYCFRKFGKTDAALDLLHVKYDEAIFTVENAYSASLAIGYELGRGLKLGIDAEYQKNPDFDKDVRVFGKLIYNFSVERGRPAARAEEGRPAPAARQQPVVAPEPPPPPAASPVVETPPVVAPSAEPQAVSQPVMEQPPAAPAPAMPAATPVSVDLPSSSQAEPQQTAPAQNMDQGQRKEGAQ